MFKTINYKMTEELNDNLPMADGQQDVTPSNEIIEVHHKELEEAVAELSEEGTIHENVSIPSKDYNQLTLDELVNELATLLKHDNIVAIKNNVEDIKLAFLSQYRHFIEEKRNEFYETNDPTTEFEYHLPSKSKFDHLFEEYRLRKNKHFNQIQDQLKTNLSQRETIIKDLKELIENGNGNIGEMFKSFNEIRDRWKNIGSIPKDKYNIVWNNYHFHLDRFYEIVHLDREIRDTDFKNNLAQKLEIIEKAKLLVHEENLTSAFRQLQQLHKVWKEEIGPVAKEKREEIWNEFSAITKQLNDRKIELLEEIKSKEQENINAKRVIIADIIQLAEVNIVQHGEWQGHIAKMEAKRDEFFKVGKVSPEISEVIWNEFKEAVRLFNAKKNSFYKEIKNVQLDNLDKKKALIEKAKEFANSEDLDTATPVMKQIQEEWKTIGHVPRKVSDEIWDEFKKVSNSFFSKLHESRKELIEIENTAYEAKSAYLESLKAFELTGDHKTDLDAIKSHIANWKTLGRVGQNKRHIEGKFNKILDALFEKLTLSKKDKEMMRYNNKLEQLSENSDSRGIVNEQIFIKRKIDEINHGINQLENNIQFISNTKGDNPFVKEVQKNIDKYKEELQLWKDKLKKIAALKDN